MLIVKKITAGLCFAVLIFSLAYTSFSQNTKELLCSNVLRLHILASSDSEQDIALKYKVRDGLMPVMEEMFNDCKNFEEAEEKAQIGKEILQSKAEEILKKHGCDDGVRIIIGQKHYDEKVLDGIKYPEGEYCSLRIVIGEGKGHNWWCVLFSPLTDAGIERNGDSSGSCNVTFKFLQWFK